jgi:hypothetical protein
VLERPLRFGVIERVCEGESLIEEPLRLGASGGDLVVMAAQAAEKLRAGMIVLGGGDQRGQRQSGDGEEEAHVVLRSEFTSVELPRTDGVSIAFMMLKA